VVDAGVTATEVPVTGPTPGAIDREVAPVTDQASVDVWPAVRAAGAAVKLAMAGGVPAPGVTVTVAVAVADPAPFVAVRV
jgi:hypothetical protein